MEWSPAGAWLTVLSLCALCACGGRSRTLRGTGGASDGSITTGAGGRGAMAGGAGTASGTGGSAGMPTCATLQLSGMAPSSHLLLMVDRSLAMRDDWMQTQQALSGFFASTKLGRTQVALRFFPDDRPTAGCSAAACSASACGDPLVDFDALRATPAPDDAQEQRLTDTVDATSLSSEAAPLGAALAGGLQLAESQPGHPNALVLVTAGAASDCPVDLDGVSNALDQYGIETYVITPHAGDHPAVLDAIASAGGTVSPASLDLDGLASVVPTVDYALGCDFPLPEPPDGQSFDFTSARFSVALESGQPTDAPRVDRESDCGDARGWYYDDPENPTRLVFCPALCDEISGAKSSSGDFSLPCR